MDTYLHCYLQNGNYEHTFIVNLKMVTMNILIIAWVISVAASSVDLSLHSFNIFKLLFGQVA